MKDQSKREVDKMSKWCKVLNDILNTAWRLCSGAGIIVAGICVSSYAQHELGTIFSLGTINNEGRDIYLAITYFIVVVSPAITADVFGAMQLFRGKDIIHIEVKIKKDKTNEVA